MCADFRIFFRSPGTLVPGEIDLPAALHLLFSFLPRTTSILATLYPSFDVSTSPHRPFPRRIQQPRLPSSSSLGLRNAPRIPFPPASFLLPFSIPPLPTSMPLSQLNSFQHTRYDSQTPKLSRQRSNSSSVAFQQPPASIRSTTSTSSSFFIKTFGSLSQVNWTRPRLRSLSKGSFSSIRRAQSQTNATFEVIGSEYQPLSAQEQHELELKRSRSVLSLAVSNHRGGTQEEEIEKLGRKICSASEYWVG